MSRVLKVFQLYRGILDLSFEYQGCSLSFGFQMIVDISGGYRVLELNVLVLEEFIYISYNGCILIFNL